MVRHQEPRPSLLAHPPSVTCLRLRGRFTSSADDLEKEPPLDGERLSISELRMSNALGN